MYISFHHNVKNEQKIKAVIFYITVPAICVASHSSSSRKRDCISFLVLHFNVANNRGRIISKACFISCDTRSR